MKHLSIPRLKLQAAVMEVKLKKQIIMEHKKEALENISHRKQQVIKAYRVAKLLHTTDVSLWKRMGGINNTPDIGTRGVVYKRPIV